MAQIETTASDLQWKSNMIGSGDTTTEWSDAKYPSAKAALDNAHPIGSIVVTSTNTSPATAMGGTREWLGGTWELIDKEYRHEVDTNLLGWTPYIINGNVAGATAGGWIARSDHMLCLKIYFTTRNEISSSWPLGSFSRELNGVADQGGFPLTTHYGGMAYADDKDRTNKYIVEYELDGSGALSVKSIYDKKTLPTQSTIYLHLNLPMTASSMLDSFCDKFYWKRIA